MRRWILGIAVTCAFFVGLGSLRPCPASPDKVCTILLSEPLPLTDFLKAVELLADVPFRWDADNHRLESTEVLMPGNLHSRPEAVLDAVRALLAARAFALRAVGDGEAAVWEVVDLTKPGIRVSFRARPVESTEESLARLDGQDGQYVTTSVRLDHAIVDEAFRAELLPLLSAPRVGHIALAPGGKGLVISDFAPHVAAVVRTARRLATLVAPEAAQDGSSDVVLLEYELVGNVLPVVRDALAGAERDLSPWTLTEAPRLNAILVRGTPRQFEATKRLIRQLDVPVDSLPPNTVEVVELTVLDARRTADAFRRLVAGCPDGWRTTPNGPVPAIVPHLETNSVLVSGPRDGVDQLAALIREREARAN